MPTITPTSSQDLAQERTDYAYERTRMAATRTYFALLRTGLSIAAGGSLVTTILVSNYPDWVVALLSSVFILVGFTIMVGALQRYRALEQRLIVDDEFETLPVRLMTVMTILLMGATIAILILFLLR